MLQKPKAFKPAEERDATTELIETQDAEDIEQLEDEFKDDPFLEQYRCWPPSSTRPNTQTCIESMHSLAAVMPLSTIRSINLLPASLRCLASPSTSVCNQLNASPQDYQIFKVIGKARHSQSRLVALSTSSI